MASASTLCYAILGADKIVVIDTLVGRGGFRRLLDDRTAAAALRRYLHASICKFDVV